mgnify:CR=1 FL=1
MIAILEPEPLEVPLWTDERGKIRVKGTRVLLELVIHAFNQGESAEEIVDSYPTLKLSSLYAVLAYYLDHRAEVNAYILQSEEAVEQIQREVEASYSPEALTLRSRLRALRDQKHPSAS